MKREDFIVRFAGEGGQGMVTSADGLAQAASMAGFHVQTFSTFPSQILGGPTWTQTRISTTIVRSSGDAIDVLVCFNREAYDNHKNEVRDDGVIIYNTGEMLEGFKTLSMLASSPDHIIPGHDPLVMARYPAATPDLEGIAVSCFTKSPNSATEPSTKSPVTTKMSG